MPYIMQDLRPLLEPTSKQNAMSSGEFNFQITRLAIRYIETHGLSYTHINDVMGAFFGAALEFYRRVALPYEDLKIEENGDVGYESLFR